MAKNQRTAKKNNRPPRVMLIGIDGLSYLLLQQLVKAGCMPTIAGLLDDGFCCEMDSTLPADPASVWSSVMTGVNPGRHGIFGFIDRKRDSYGIYFPNFSQLQAPPFWHHLARYRKRTVVLNLPQTYPVSEIDGVLVAGYMADDLEKAVYPPQLVSALREVDYRIDIDYVPDADGFTKLFEHLSVQLKKHVALSESFLNKTSWDVFLTVLTGSAYLLQYIWPDQQAHTLETSGAKQFFTAIDAAVSKIVKHLESDDHLIIFSNYGFRPAHTTFQLNTWLARDALLDCRTSDPLSLDDIDPSSTKAFALESGRLYINRKNVMPAGCVASEADSNRLLKLINQQLLCLKSDSGRPIIGRVFRKEDIYDGPYIEKAPDMVLVPAAGVELKARVGQAVPLQQAAVSSVAVADNAFVYMHGRSKLSRRPHVTDIVPTIAALLGISSPKGLDGQYID